MSYTNTLLGKYVTIIFTCLLLLLLLSSLECASAARSLGSGAASKEYVTVTHLKIDHNKKQVVYGAKEVKNCKPKGFRHSSAPSRFVNYHSMGSVGCSSTGKGKP